MSNYTYSEQQMQAIVALRNAGVQDAQIDVRSLMSYASGLSRSQVILSEQDIMPPKVAEKFLTFVARRKNHEPIAYIVGEKGFWSLTFKLNTHVLIPRPETEGVVEQALKLLGNQAGARILDVGTGCGTILISLLHELPTAQGCGVDISENALELAQRNAQLSGVADRCTFKTSDFLQGVRGQYDIVVANPPYITTPAMQELAPDVEFYEPHLALDGGPDGLSAYKSIIKDLPNVLKAGGHVVFEIGYDQKTAVSGLLAATGATSILCQQDLAGHDRIISAAFC